jgi:hypothetical protein
MAFPKKEDAFPNLAAGVELPARKESTGEAGRKDRASMPWGSTTRLRPSPSCREPRFRDSELTRCASS